MTMPQADAAPLQQAPILVVTRFSFLGSSGWKSDASRDPELLFTRDRLELRLRLFRAVTLPSLAAQTDPGFHHLVLTSDRLPDWALAALTEACLQAYGDAARFSILASRPTLARNPLRTFMEQHFPGQVVVQVVLDDDDGLASDYMSDLRHQLAALEADKPGLGEESPYFISYPLGYGLVLRGDPSGGGAAGLYLHRYPFINAGLVLIGAGSGKNILGIDHRAAPRRFGAKVVPGKPMFLRSLHDFNDSRVVPGERWSQVADWEAEPGLRSRFSCLFAEDAPWGRPGMEDQI